MRVTINYYGPAREITKKSIEQIDVAPEATVRDLRLVLAEKYARLGPLLERSRVALGLEYVADEFPLQSEVEITIIPPVAGG